MPGNEWPEKWIVEECDKGNKDILKNDLGLDDANIVLLMEKIKLSEKHSEFYDVCNFVSMDKQIVANSLIRNVH